MGAHKTPGRLSRSTGLSPRENAIWLVFFWMVVCGVIVWALDFACRRAGMTLVELLRLVWGLDGQDFYWSVAWILMALCGTCLFAVVIFWLVYCVGRRPPRPPG